MATMTKVLIHIPVAMKKQLDSLRTRGYSVSGFVRFVLEKELNQYHTKKGA